MPRPRKSWDGETWDRVERIPRPACWNGDAWCRPTAVRRWTAPRERCCTGSDWSAGGTLAVGRAKRQMRGPMSHPAGWPKAGVGEDRWGWDGRSGETVQGSGIGVSVEPAVAVGADVAVGSEDSSAGAVRAAVADGDPAGDGDAGAAVGDADVGEVISGRAVGTLAARAADPWASGVSRLTSREMMPSARMRVCAGRVVPWSCIAETVLEGMGCIEARQGSRYPNDCTVPRTEATVNPPH